MASTRGLLRLCLKSAFPKARPVDNLMSVFSKNPLQKKKHFGGTTLFLPIRYRNWPSVFSSRAQRHPPKKTDHCESSSVRQSRLLPNLHRRPPPKNGGSV